MSLERSPQVRHSRSPGESVEKISLRRKYDVILDTQKGWVKNVPRPIEEADSEILANLEAQLGQYANIPSAVQSTAKYMELIKEITDPNGEIYKQIVLMISKPGAEDLLEYLNGEYNSISRHC